MLQDMRVDTLVQIQYAVPLNQNGVDNAEDACQEAKSRLLKEMEGAFARQGITMVRACVWRCQGLLARPEVCVVRGPGP